MKDYTFQCPNSNNITGANYKCLNDKFVQHPNREIRESQNHAVIKCQNEGCPITIELRSFNEFNRDPYSHHFYNCNYKLAIC